MKPEQVRAAIDAGAVILDLHTPQVFITRHLPGAVNLQFNRADLAERASLALPKGLECILHAEPEPVARVAVTILTRAGLTVSGHLEGGLAAWRAAGLPIEVLPAIDVTVLRDGVNRFRPLDAREPFEYRYGHALAPPRSPWTDCWQSAGALARNGPFAVYCGTRCAAR